MNPFKVGEAPYCGCLVRPPSVGTVEHVKKLDAVPSEVVPNSVTARERAPDLWEFPTPCQLLRGDRPDYLLFLGDCFPGTDLVTAMFVAQPRAQMEMRI